MAVVPEEHVGVEGVFEPLAERLHILRSLMACQLTLAGDGAVRSADAHAPRVVEDVSALVDASSERGGRERSVGMQVPLD